MSPAGHTPSDPDREVTRRVVLCDDQDDVRDALREAVESVPGFTVVGVAADGDGCLEVLRRDRPDVLVQDVSLPGGGPVLTAAVRAEHPDLVIIAFSAHAEPSVRQGMLDAGADEYVVKSGRLAPLREALLRHEMPAQ